MTLDIWVVVGRLLSVTLGTLVLIDRRARLTLGGPDAAFA